jgi:hypothetical protein
MKGIMKYIAIAGSSAFFGVMLTIGAGLIPFFYLAGPTAFEQWFSAYFVFLLPGVLLTSLPALFSSLTLMRRSAKSSLVRVLWRNTAISIAVVYAITSVIHLPLNILFWSMELSDEVIIQNLGFWSAAHALRLAGALVASYFAFKAVSISSSGKK